ncbi:BTB/POZ domain-containing protein 6-A-like [Oratosquilla oratoria]|uniref:BTB/POZ domain-containing protein 6-A-like n=1 Tax=Oratosquilla oratoria TaxID=337810 RepID=UPI003F76E713
MIKSGSMGEEWHMAKKSSKERLQYLHTSDEYSDLDIIFPEHETTIKAHRLILSMSSPVFGAMLMGPMAVAKELPLPEDSPQTFKKLLEHIYLDEMNLESVEEALEVYALAKKYMVESAWEACVQYIRSNIGNETVLAVLDVSIFYEDEELNKKCKEVLNRDPDAVMLSETVSHLSRTNLKNLLKDSTIMFSSEVVPFKGLIRWGKAQLVHQEEPSGSVLREKIGDLLEEVRFMTMSCDEFVDNVVDTNIFTHTECIHILGAIRGADPYTLPEEATPLRFTNNGMRLREIKQLPHCILSSYESNENASYDQSSDICLIENLSSNRTIYVHYLIGISDGTINILDDKGEVVGSATSEIIKYTFTRPVALKKDKLYRVKSFPNKEVIFKYSRGKCEKENVTFSWSKSAEVFLYFCKSPSR